MIAISTWRQLKKKKLRKLIRAWKDFVSNDMRKRRTILELFKWKRRDLLMRAWSTLKNITTWFGHTTAIRKQFNWLPHIGKVKGIKKLKYCFTIWKEKIIRRQHLEMVTNLNTKYVNVVQTVRKQHIKHFLKSFKHTEEISIV